jgi:hypothetical protein
MTRLQRVAQTYLTLMGLLTCVFLGSVYADTSETAFPDDANALIATAGIGLGVMFMVLAVAGINSGERWAWLALWVMPTFFVAHVLLLGTWLPDGVFAVVTAAAVIVTRPRYTSA